MPWPKGRSRRGFARKSNREECPFGHVGEFSRGADGKRKCRACQRYRTRRKRVAAILAGWSRQ